MTTAVHQKPAIAPAPSKPSPVIFQGNVALEKIVVRDQVRKKFDENAHKELTESVRTKGVINPVTLRPLTGGKYQLVAGERRYRAAAAAGLKEIPATVRDLDDQAAALYQVEENIHRKDLTPIEEARGFDLLFKAKKFTVEQLAQLIDKSVPYVYRAVKLLDLSDAVLKAIEEGKLTPAHGHQILRVTADKRKEMEEYALRLDYNQERPTAKDLMERIDQDLSYSLADAVFPKDKEFAGAIACTGCQYNTGNQGKLFDGAEKGGCTNKPCFDKKTEVSWALKVEALKKRFPETSVAFHNYNLVPGMSIHGSVIKGELSATAKNLKEDQTLVISKQDGKVYIASKAKAVKPKPVADVRKPATEKEKFIAAYVNEQLETLTAEKIKKADPKTILAAINASLKECYQGRQLKAAGLFPITAANVLKVYFQDRIEDAYYNDEQRMTALGLDFKKESATLAKAATEKWDKEHPAKPASKA